MLKAGESESMRCGAGFSGRKSFLAVRPGRELYRIVDENRRLFEYRTDGMLRYSRNERREPPRLVRSVLQKHLGCESLVDRTRSLEQTYAQKALNNVPEFIAAITFIFRDREVTYSALAASATATTAPPTANASSRSATEKSGMPRLNL